MRVRPVPVTAGWGLLLLLLLGGGPASARQRPRVRRALPHLKPTPTTLLKRPVSAASLPRRSGPVRVTYVSGDRAFLDAGRDDGLAAGQMLSLGARVQSRCRVTELSEHAASCAFLKRPPHPGDGVAWTRRHPKPVPVAQLATLTRAEDLPAQRRGLAETSAAPVVFRAGVTRGVFAQRRMEVEASWTTWNSRPSVDGSFSQARVDVSLQEVQVLPGLRASVDATVLAWTERPPSSTFPPRSNVQLIVRQVELSARERGSAFTFSGGRIWPWHAPGTPVLDGVEAGWRSRSGGVELGVLGGAVPNALTTLPTLQRPLVGAYLALTDAAPSLASHYRQLESTVAIQGTPDQGFHTTLETLGRGWWGTHTELGADLRVGYGEKTVPGFIEGARADVRVHPTDTLTLATGARYLADPLQEVEEIGAARATTRTLFWDGRASFDARSFWVSLQGGLARDLSLRLGRWFLGPEVTFPRAWGRFGSIALGYQEERGWLGGRDVFVQTVLTPAARLRILARASYFLTSASPGTNTASETELDATLGAELPLTRWLWLRANVLGRLLTASPRGTPPSPFPVGLNASASAVGTF